MGSLQEVFDNNNQWKNKVKVQSWAKEGNHTNGYVGWMRLYLKNTRPPVRHPMINFIRSNIRSGMTEMEREN